ncbi:MAG: folate-binding protein, partial [Symploca sp. SIO2G7]|nr:folate-binding protein [Symploca sp. SIO2G7]
APSSHIRASLPAAIGNDATIRIARGTSLAMAGYTLIGEKNDGALIKQWLVNHNVVSLLPDQWEALRIRQGRPMPGYELTDQDNPLEAGLWHSISFDKGCYIGQEIIARLSAYRGVKKQLWGFKLGQFVPPNVSLYLEGAKVGKLTSVIADDTGVWGLGYLRTKAGGAGLVLEVENTTAEAVDLPFASRGYLETSAIAST